MVDRCGRGETFKNANNAWIIFTNSYSTLGSAVLLRLFIFPFLNFLADVWRFNLSPLRHRITSFIICFIPTYQQASGNLPLYAPNVTAWRQRMQIPFQAEVDIPLLLVSGERSVDIHLGCARRWMGLPSGFRYTRRGGALPHQPASTPGVTAGGRTGTIHIKLRWLASKRSEHYEFYFHFPLGSFFPSLPCCCFFHHESPLFINKGRLFGTQKR